LNKEFGIKKLYDITPRDTYVNLTLDCPWWWSWRVLLPLWNQLIW